MYLKNLFIFLSLFRFSQSLSNEERLYEHLFLNNYNIVSGEDTFSGDGESGAVNGSQYDSRVRPVINFHDSVNTSFSIKINSLDFFKQPEEKIKFNVELDLYWNDQFLKWDPNEFNNATTINISPNDIWIPDIELYNSSSFKFFILSSEESLWFHTIAPFLEIHTELIR